MVRHERGEMVWKRNCFRGKNVLGKRGTAKVGRRLVDARGSLSAAGKKGPPEIRPVRRRGRWTPKADADR